MNKVLAVIGITLISSAVHALEVSAGKLQTYAAFSSEFIPARDVHVWVPDGYAESADGRKYAVLYMHDGQMLFDASVTWNKQEWGVDEVAGTLHRQNLVRPFIVVGIDNGDELRQQEYFPEKPFQALKARDRSSQEHRASTTNVPFLAAHDAVTSDEYLRFLVYELKPFIDKNYAVHTDRDNTAVMGSSMGGLISLYAISEYPEVFGAAACISTHWPGARNPPGNPIPDAFFDYMQQHLPNPTTHRIYFDHGTETLDALYPEYQEQADKVVRAKGYTADNWVTKVFDGHAHDENSWRSRLDIPMQFLFADTPDPSRGGDNRVSQ